MSIAIDFDNVTETQHITDAVAQSAMLVDIHIHTWSFTKTDRSLSPEIAAAHQADAKAFAVVKSLFPGADHALRECVAIQSAWRARSAQLTLPTTMQGTRSNGTRLLANAMFEKFAAEFVRAKNELDAALDKAQASYADAMQAARARLGSTFNEDDYPSVEGLRRRFAIRVHYMPVPRSFSGVALPPGLVDALNDQLGDAVTEKVDNALDDLKQRTVTLAERLVGRFQSLADDMDSSKEGRKTPLHEALFRDARDFGDTLDAYAGMFDDERFSRAASLLRYIGRQDRETIRQDRDTLDEVLDLASSVRDCFEL